MSAAANATAWCDDYSPSDAYASLFEPAYQAGVVTQGRKVSPKLERGTWVWNFRNRIREGSECPINFGGHYNIVFWGVGTEAKEGALIDARDGRTYDLPPAKWEYIFHPDSRLLIIDPVVPEASDPLTFSHKGAWQWDERAKSWENVSLPDASFSPRVLSTWKAIAYNQNGKSYVAKGFETQLQASQVALAECLRLYGECSAGVSTLSDWTIHLGQCVDNMYAFVSIGVSPDQEIPIGDAILDELIASEKPSCEVISTY